MEWMIICIFVVGISCFFIGFCIRRRNNNNRQNVRDEVLINDSNNRQNESDVLDENRNNMVRESTGAHEVILVNADINKDLSISHSSYQINSKVLKGFNNPFQRDASVFMASCRVAKRKSNSFKSNSFGKNSIQNLAISKTNFYQINSFGKSRIQNLTISKTNLIINNNIGIGRDLQNKYGSLKIVENINFDVIDNRHYCNKGVSVFRQPGIFRRRLEELEKIEKQEIEQMKQRLLRKDRKIKSRIKNMPAPEPIPIYEDVKEDDKNIKKKLDK